jgi:penicillin-binding protein 1A
VLYQSAGQSCANCADGDPTQPPQLSQPGQQVADPDSAYQIITMMKGVVLRGTGVPAVNGIPQPVAGKTGTTNNFNDAWFIGFTPGIVTGCWIGFDQPQSLGNAETGGSVCGPIWNEYMKAALKDQPVVDFATPPGMSLEQTAEPDGTEVTEAFKPGQTPGAQDQNSMLGGDDTSLDGSTATPPPGGDTGTPQPGTSGSPPANSGSSLGGLY